MPTSFNSRIAQTTTAALFFLQWVNPTTQAFFVSRPLSLSPPHKQRQDQQTALSPTTKKLRHPSPVPKITSQLFLLNPETLTSLATTTTITTVQTIQEASSISALLPTSQILSLLAKKGDPEAARGIFWFAFFAGSGAGGIGFGQVPAVISQIRYVNSLKDVGPSLGGTALRTSPVTNLLYPTSSLYEKDVAAVIAKIPRASVIASRSMSNAYFATKGYVGRDDFVRECEKLKCNPLASYVVFDALSGGKGSFVSPAIFEETLAKWRSGDGTESFTSDLEKAVLTRFVSYAGLAFLLLLTLDFVVENGIEGFLS
mmetsp:Transcript_61307/g.72809  ORF Transcript_61307/g.72809 Transcript_61307/m.72809 type:complete len:314 (-) Transcript_61307:98-1039(-)|eukprot:CAMPEP_0172516212 /NCGR_PEP_ID=MMETSP1066-20121228/274400_1 /TAXON_ID=671091 /ORGANISM="Coscinodiscus wailesii, Strain CCMP2513" /LENGTH=313 /DNA_ID=CAMNT_0013297593 /DNA_START=166 /DNA_END=1107 /DNA_ORIENTATION=-